MALIDLLPVEPGSLVGTTTDESVPTYASAANGSFFS